MKTDLISNTHWLAKCYHMIYGYVTISVNMAQYINTLWYVFSFSSNCLWDWRADGYWRISQSRKAVETEWPGSSELWSFQFVSLMFRTVGASVLQIDDTVKLSFSHSYCFSSQTVAAWDQAWVCVCVSPAWLASQPISWSARFEVDSLICPRTTVLKGILSSHTFSADELNKWTALASMCHHRSSRYWWHIKLLDRAESACNFISCWTGIKRNGWDWAATLMHSGHMMC